MQRRVLAAAALAVAATALMAQNAPPPAAGGPTLVAFECGRIVQENLGAFSDTFRFQGERRELIAGCYLIRHAKGVLLWDTGLTPELIGGGGPKNLSLTTTIPDRLKALGLSPRDVTHVGISHYHGDHSGGARDFAHAELLIGRGDWEAVQKLPESDRNRAQLAPWLAGSGGKVTQVARDRDVFGDGSVVMLAMPGHTPGHTALLVRLPKSGPVLLSGDQFHFRENRGVRGVPTFNTDRADTLASHDRFEEIARNTGARVVIQHDPRDMAELPAFPKGLD